MKEQDNLDKEQKDLYIPEIYLHDISHDPKVFSYKGKPIIPTKTALNELSNINLNLYEIPTILTKGFRLRKRKHSITEKAIIKGKKIINVVVVDLGNAYKLIHVGEFTISKKFKQIQKPNKHRK